jgi:hypothetical protein
MTMRATIILAALLISAAPAMAGDYSGRNEMPRALRGHWCFTKGDHGSEAYRKRPPSCPKAKKTLHVYADGFFSLVDKGEIKRPCSTTEIKSDSVGGWTITADCRLFLLENKNETAFYFFPRRDGTLSVAE